MSSRSEPGVSSPGAVSKVVLLAFVAAAACVGVTSWLGVGPALACAGLAAAGAGAAYARTDRSRRQADLIVTLLGRFANGDLRALEPEHGATLGALAEPLRHVMARGQAIRGAARRLQSSLSGLPEAIGQADAEVSESRSAIEETVEETASLLAQINGSIRGITSEVESLASSSEESSSSILEMGSAIDEVARNAGALHDAAGASASAVHELSGSIRQVAESADAVQGMAEESAAAMVEMEVIRIGLRRIGHARMSASWTATNSGFRTSGNILANGTLFSEL